LIKIVILFYCFVLIKGLLLHLVNFISNNVLTPDANVLHICITLIHKLKAVDENGHARGPKRVLYLLVLKTDVPLSTTLNGNRTGGKDTTHTCHG
jgi:hypothetical protein